MIFKRQISRFLFVGILNTIVGVGAYYILLYLNVYYMIAAVGGHVIGVTHSFLWNKQWTFKSKGNIRKEGLRFFSVYGVTFLINLFLLVLFVEKFMIDPKIAAIFALGIVAIISFFGHKYWSFRDVSERN
jgi:putative flippase GtrA